MIRIKIYDREYPYLPTMGALLAFKQETGMEAHEVPTTDIALNVKFAYFVVKYACLHFRENVLELSFEEFCNGLSVESYYKAVAASMNAAAGEGAGTAKK